MKSLTGLKPPLVKTRQNHAVARWRKQTFLAADKLKKWTRNFP